LLRRHKLSLFAPEEAPSKRLVPSHNYPRNILTARAAWIAAMLKFPVRLRIFGDSQKKKHTLQLVDFRNSVVYFFLRLVPISPISPIIRSFDIVATLSSFMVEVNLSS
jgi:hypothetical protein